MVVSLAFDDDGSMLIGFLDRFGHLAGVANHDPQGNGYYDGFTGGDLLRAYNNKGTFELESNGKAGDRTGSGVGNGEGPGGGEFYGTDYWIFLGHRGHSEVTNGALTLIPGYDEVISSAFDPITDIFKTGGIKVFNNTNGLVNRNVVLYNNSPGSFGKASGLGDIKALCDAAPLAIGNRVWFDDNRNGIQDAYEPGIDGIVLTLHDMEDNGKLVATQTTHDGGLYYFNNTTVPGGLIFGHRYQIRMDMAQLPKFDLTVPTTPQAAPGARVAARNAGARIAAADRSYVLSPANRSDFVDAYLRDSNAQLTGSFATIDLTTGEPGQNDFTFDLSVYSCPQLKAEVDTIPICPGAKIDSIVADTKYLSRFDSVRFVLFSTPQSGTAMYENTGTVLSTVKPGADNRAVLHNPQIDTSNNGPESQQQYVYAIIYPTPEDPTCRQSDKTVLNISPALSVTATGGTLTCSVTRVTLAGQALYAKGTQAPGMAYSWTGPASFSSSQQNPSVTLPGTYTLTVSNPTCPGSLTTALAVVSADTAKPVLTTSIELPLCLDCATQIHAYVPGGAIFDWTGPNGFSGTGADPQFKTPGMYTVTATGSNGCKLSASVEVKPIPDPCLGGKPKCIPLMSSRIR